MLSLKKIQTTGNTQKWTVWFLSEKCIYWYPFHFENFLFTMKNKFKERINQMLNWLNSILNYHTSNLNVIMGSYYRFVALTMPHYHLRKSVFQSIQWKHEDKSAVIMIITFHLSWRNDNWYLALTWCNTVHS